MEALQKIVVRLQEAHKTTEGEEKVRVPKDVPKKIEEALHAYLHRTYRNPRINLKKSEIVSKLITVLAVSKNKVLASVRNQMTVHKMKIHWFIMSNVHAQTSMRWAG